MLKPIITSALCVLAISLFAQTGLFNLSFGDSFGQAEKQLLSQGLLKKEQADNAALFIPKSSDLLHGLKVYMDPMSSKVVGWLITYKPQTEPDTRVVVTNQLKKLHGNGKFVRSLGGLAWNIDNTHQILFYPNQKTGVYCVLYMDSNYEDYYN